MPIDEHLVARLYKAAQAARWRVDRATFARALEAAVAKRFGGTGGSGELEQFLSRLHLQDLALACACAGGDEAAWEHFVREFRPLLYRAAEAIAPGGDARDLADSMYAELFGLKEPTAQRRSLFAYYHGRSSLATWLRAVLAQRHVDRVRQRRRLDALPDDESGHAPQVLASTPDPDRARFSAMIRAALEAAVGRLAARDRLRLACYYARQMTLAQVGQLLGEHEATVSRQLTRARTAIRERVEQSLASDHHLGAAQIAECFTLVAEDAGGLDLGELLGSDSALEPVGADQVRKESALDRSRRGE